MAFVTEVDPSHYTRCYCEENIYCLLRDRLSSQQVVNSTVVFISGKRTEYIPFFCQRGAGGQNAPVYWKDYHVILVSRICTGAEPSVVVFDLDSTITENRGHAIPFDIYVAMTLYNAGCTDPMARSLSTYRIREAPRSFRVIPAMEYLRNFASDRSHMRRKGNQGMDEWLAPPPPYAPITNEDQSNTFPCYRDFKSKDSEANPVFGRIIDQLAFLKKFDMPGAEEFENLPSLAQWSSFESLQLPPPDNTDQGQCNRKRWPLIDRNPGGLTGGDLQNKPQSIPPEKGLIRLRSDGQYVVLVCSDCKADRFSDLADFDEHCRVVHAKEYGDENERDMACGQVVRRGSSDWVISQDQGPSDALGLEPSAYAFTLPDMPSFDRSLKRMRNE